MNSFSLSPFIVGVFILFFSFFHKITSPLLTIINSFYMFYYIIDMLKKPVRDWFFVKVLFYNILKKEIFFLT